jgi:hypothetical protein
MVFHEVGPKVGIGIRIYARKVNKISFNHILLTYYYSNY